MNAITIFRTLSDWGPVLFGIGFVAPLIAQSLEAASLPIPMELSPIQFGLAIALPISVVAKLRGRWI